MCQRVKYLITSTNDETGRKWGVGLFLCDWHYSLFCEKQLTRMHVHTISGTVSPCFPSTPTTSPPQWLWPSLSYHWLVRAASCFFCISVDERMRVRERQSHEPVPSVFFSPMFLPTRCLPPTLSQQRWNFSASSLARSLVLSSCSLPVTLPSTICTFCFSHTLCLSFLNSTFFILTFFSLFNSVLHPTLTLFFWHRANLKKKKKEDSLSLCVFVCVSAICLLHSKTQRLSMRIWSLHCQWNVVTVLLLKLFLVK